MGQFKGTQGEWIVCDQLKTAVIVNKGGQLITALKESSFSSKEEAEANAKIIAASRKMLAVLEKLIRGCGSGNITLFAENKEEITIFKENDFEIIIEEVEAIIKEATE